MRKAYGILFGLFVFFYLNFAINILFPQKACADSPSDYDAGTCSSSGSICYTNGSAIKDLAPGYECGDLPNYVLGLSDSPQGVGLAFQSNGVPQCKIGGFCCDPGKPLPSLPPHKGYNLGFTDGLPGCKVNSVCYTGPHDNAASGQQCGTLSGWYYGVTANSTSGPPQCGGVSGTGQAGVCCDTTSTSFTPTPPNACPTDNGICKTVDTAPGPINVSNLGAFVKAGFEIILSISGAWAVVIIIFSGYGIMFSQGDPEKIKANQEQLVSAVVGLLFMIFSVTILHIIGYDVFRFPGF